MVFYQYWATSQKEGISKGEHSLALKCKSEVLPLQYQDSGEVSCKSKKNSGNLTALLFHVKL